MGKESRTKHDRKLYNSRGIQSGLDHFPKFRSPERLRIWVRGVEYGFAESLKILPEAMEDTTKSYAEYMVTLGEIKQIISRIDTLIQNRNNYKKLEPYKQQLITLRANLGSAGLVFESKALALFQEYGLVQIETDLNAWRTTLSFIVDAMQDIISGKADGSVLANVYAQIPVNIGLDTLINASLKRERGPAAARVFVGRKAFELESDDSTFTGKGGMQRAGWHIIEELEAAAQTKRMTNTQKSALEWLNGFKDDLRRLGQEVSAAKIAYCQDLA